MQDRNIVDSHLEAEDNPSRFHHRYDLVQVDLPSHSGHLVFTVPNKNMTVRNKRLVDELLHQSAYHDHNGRVYIPSYSGAYSRPPTIGVEVPGISPTTAILEQWTYCSILPF